MTLVEHLEELRHRLIVCIIAVGCGAVIGWFLYGPVLNLILNPYCDYWKTIPPKLRVNRSCSLFFQEPLGAMIVKLKIVVFIGLVVVLPVLLYQLWMFIVPGLTKKERRMAIPFVGSSVVLFALGAFVSYIMLPKGLNFLLGFAGSELRADTHRGPIHHVRDPRGGGVRVVVRVPGAARVLGDGGCPLDEEPSEVAAVLHPGDRDLRGDHHARRPTRTRCSR